MLIVPPDEVAGLLDAVDHLRASQPSVDCIAAPLTAASTRPRRPVELSAPRHLLRELLIVAVDEAADKLSAHSTRLLRGAASAAEMRAGLTELSRLVDLLDQVERAR